MIGVTVVMGALAVSAYRTYAVRSADRGRRHGRGSDPAAESRGRSSATVRRLRTSTPPASRLTSPTSALAEFVESVQDRERADRAALRSQRGRGPSWGSVLSLTPFETAEQDVVWICGNRAPSVGLQPLGFVGGSRQATQVLTTIDTRYLPSICR